MPGDLREANIIVTRPAIAAKALIKTLQQLEAHVTSMPLFATEALCSSEKLSQLARDLPRYDLVICISRNAAEQILSYITDVAAISWATIGPATAEYLQQCGASNVICPLQLPFDSNSLLSELQLRAKTLKNQCIMILAGADGSNLLAEALQQQGAQVEIALLYKRTMPKMSAIEVQAILNNTPAIDIMVITCITSLDSLETLAKAAGVNPFGIPLLVVSSRIYTYAVERGFVNVRAVNGMSDANIVAALLSWRNDASE